MKCLRRWLSRALLCLLVIAALPALAQDFTREKLRIPMEAAGPRGLEALLVRPAGDERLPLAIITHGASANRNIRLNMTPLLYEPAALEFARRGFAVVVVMRRGYGDSGVEYLETYGPCEDRDYVHAGLTSAEDLRAAIAHLATRPDIDATRILAIGQSGGGFAVTALTRDPPAGLVAAINFAGGRGGKNDKSLCGEDRLVRAFRALGAQSRVPMLWIYAANDLLFGPERARRFHQAFTEGGGTAEFIEAPAFRTDGHSLFVSAFGRPIWTPLVDAFLARRGLVPRQELIALPVPTLAPPDALDENGRKSFAEFLQAAPHRAFALSPDGAFGWVSGKRTIAAAKHGALERCRKHAKDCRVVIVDEAPVPDEIGAR